MIKRITTIVTVLVFILGVAIVYAKASPQVDRVQHVQDDVFAVRNYVMVNENRDLAVVSYQRERFALNRVHMLVGTDSSDVALYERALVRRYVQNNRVRYDMDNDRARGLVQKVDAPSVQLNRPVMVAVVPRCPVDYGAVMRVAAVPRNVDGAVLLAQERLTDSVVNLVEPVAVRGV